MNGSISGLVAILEAQRLFRAQFEYEDPGEEEPSRVRRAAAALRERFAPIATKVSQNSERHDVARDPVSVGD
jgi:hypothetical protein